MENIRIGNSVHVSWRLYNNNGSQYALSGKIRRLWIISAALEKEITSYGIQGRNEIVFSIPADDLIRYGTYKIRLTIRESESETEDATYDLTQIFQVVSQSYPNASNAIGGVADLSFTSVLNNVVIERIEGLSAYEIAVNNGYEGTEQEWIAMYDNAVTAANNAAEEAIAATETVMANEESRQLAESARDSAEQARMVSEQSRVSAERARAQAEQVRQTAEQGRASSEQSRTIAETARETRAASDHATAQSDHATAANDHSVAASDHAAAATDHTIASSDHSIAVADHEASTSATEDANDAADAANDAVASVQHIVETRIGSETIHNIVELTQAEYDALQTKRDDTMYIITDTEIPSSEVGIAGFEQTTESAEDGGTNIWTVTLTNGQTFQLAVKNGKQGNSGYSGAAGELEVVNNLTDGGATAALSAEMGKELDGKVSQLRSEVDELRDDVGDKEEIIHRTDLAFTLESGKVIAVESSIFGKNSTDANLQRTSYIPIGGYVGKKLVFSQLVDTANSPIAGAVFYSSLSQNAGIAPGYVAIHGSSYGLTEVEVAIPNNAAYFRFTIPNGFESSAYCYIKEVEYTYADGLGKRVQELEEEQNDTVLSLDFLPPIAKYASVSSGKVSYYNVSGAESVQIPAGLFIGKTIKITASMPNSTYNVVCVIADRMGNSLGFYKDGAATEYKDFEVTIPAGAFYIYINYKDTSSPVVRINYEGGTIGDYLLQLSPNADLWGKSCVCFGDSITWYDGQAYNWGKEQGQIAKGYESYMRELGMVVNNMGYSGANITVILSRIRSTDVSSYDFVTITSGANDSRYQIPIGELTESGSVFDETTFIGALQAGIEYILTNNPTAKILLMTPIKGWIYYPEGYVNTARPLVSGDGIVEKKYADAIKAVAAFYSLPVCDWYNEAGVNLLTRSWFINDPDPDPEATPNPNDLYSLHPTAAGYKRMADILIPVLRNM